MNELFLERVKDYFDDYDSFLCKLNEPCTHGFFLNTKKALKNDILNLIDFEYKASPLTELSYYHFNDNIGKTKAYELGLIYPQEIAASIPSLLPDYSNIHTVVDLCSSPGGKTINVLNKLNDDAIVIANEYNYKRAQILSSNLERLGLFNVIITNKETKDLADQLENFADLVILDAPCSGEGMIRKYPEILDDYSINNIEKLASLQKNLLEDAYRILKGGGQLLYSTCTYAKEEDENQVNDFVNRHQDLHLLKTDKLSPLDNTEGQFMALLVKDENDEKSHVKSLKTVRNKLVETFIKDNLYLDDYYLYSDENRYYLSIVPLINIGFNVIRYAIPLGEIINNRFEPFHALYRAVSLKNKYKRVYDLNDQEYLKFVSGEELKIGQNNGYYLVTYHNHSLGYGKCSNGILKNKYPKGLRRMI